ncbi:MAG: hypothetical protein ACJ8AW_09025 [Rhodopila sp.]
MTMIHTDQPGLILAPGPDGWWDSERISSPRVLRRPDGTWMMWYYGRDAAFDRMINLPTGRCGLATSADGIHWDRVRGPLTMGAVFEPSPDPDRFDSSHVGVSDVQFFDGLFWMWYFGGDHTIQSIGTFTVKGFHMHPGCAVSRDGINWVRLEGPYRGALLNRGGDGAFDARFCGWPKVLRDADGWKMYYHTLDADRLFRVGLAVSADGLRWEKVGQILGPGTPGRFDDRGVGTRDVLKIGRDYVMVFEGVSHSGYHAIGLARSDDGIHWEKVSGSQPDGSIFTHAPKGSGRWDARAVGTPCVVPMADGSFRLYYIGANEGGHDELSTQHQIGLAVSDGPDFRRWRRWNER